MPGLGRLLTAGELALTQAQAAQWDGAVVAACQIWQETSGERTPSSAAAALTAPDPLEVPVPLRESPAAAAMAERAWADYVTTTGGVDLAIVHHPGVGKHGAVIKKKGVADVHRPRPRPLTARQGACRRAWVAGGPR